MGTFISVLCIACACLSNKVEGTVSTLAASNMVEQATQNNLNFNHIMYEYGEKPSFLYDELLEHDIDPDCTDDVTYEPHMDTSGKTSSDGIYNHNLQDVSSSQLKKWPYRGVVQLVCEYDSNKDGKADFSSYGTGALVGSNVLLTASHVVYSANYGWPLKTKVYVEADGTPVESTCVETCEVSAYNVGVNYRTGDASDDWAYCKLDSNVGDTYGYFEVMNHSMSIDTTSVRMVAYQGTTGKMTYASDKVRNTLTNYKFFHRIDALAGSSGAPIFYGNSNVIVGIHSGGIHSSSLDYNVACRISSYIESWILTAREDWVL